MTDPLDTNDDWAELARELERDKPPAPEPVEIVESHSDSRAEEAEGEPEGAGDEEFEDAEEGAPGEAGEATAEGEQAGTGRKRRRRRRRRRKGGVAPAEGIAGATPNESAEDEGETVAEAEEEPIVEAVTENEEYEVEDLDTEPAPLAAEEDTASEVLRDLIATWNVPSWDDIVGGLYRPN